MLKKQEFMALNWLRFFLSLYIVLFHTFNETYKLKNSFPVISALLDLGNFATSIFFVLSGFLLTYVYVSLRGGKHIDRRAFFVSRLSALYPIHLFTILLALPFFFALIYRHGGIEVPIDVLWRKTRLLGSGETIFALLMNLTLTHAWNPLYLLLNPPSWSLSALLFFYFLFPSLAPWLNRCQSPKWGLAILGILFFLPGAFAQLMGLSDIVTDGVMHRNPVIRLPLFLGGILLCVIFARRAAEGNKKPDVPTTIGSGFLVLMTVAIAAYWQSKNSDHLLHVIRNGIYFPAALAVVWIFANVAPAKSEWNQRWSARLGKASLSIFALHFPLFDIFRRSEKFVRAFILTYGEGTSFASLCQTAKNLDESILAYPIYFLFVVVASIALQEKIVNPIQKLIKGRYLIRKCNRAAFV
jgi:peptidoglycan/LPS O-acetylase OafA/YrhL